MDRQKTLPLLAAMPNIRLATDAEILICRRSQDALYETIRRAGRPRKAIEADCEISSSHMSRILEGSRTLPDAKRHRFFEACQNLYALQHEAYGLGCRLVRRDITAEEENALLRERLLQLEQRRA